MQKSDQPGINAKIGDFEFRTPGGAVSDPSANLFITVAILYCDYL